MLQLDGPPTRPGCRVTGMEFAVNSARAAKKRLVPSGAAAADPEAAVRVAVGRGYAGIVALSAVSNLFMLSGSIFMLLVYDRVLPSGSVPTLVALLILLTCIYVGLAALETLRLRAATRIADWFGDEAGPSVMQFAIRHQAGTTGRHATVQVNAMQDFDRLRGFIGSPAAIALCDLPWLPIYLIVAFLFHRDLGLLAVAGVAILLGLAALGDYLAQAPTRVASSANARRAKLFETVTRNAARSPGSACAAPSHGVLPTPMPTALGFPAVRRQHGAVCRHVEGYPAAAAVGIAGARRLSGAAQRDHAGHDHRGVDHHLAGHGAGRAGDRPLARLRRRTAELAAHEDGAAGLGTAQPRTQLPPPRATLDVAASPSVPRAAGNCCSATYPSRSVPACRSG